MIDDILRSTLKNGKNAVKNGVRNGVRNGAKNGVRNGITNGLSGGDLAKQAIIENYVAKSSLSVDVKFTTDVVSSKFDAFTNKPVARRKGIDTIPDREVSREYLNSAKAYYAEKKTLSGFPFHVDAMTGQIYKVRSGSKFNKDGTLVVKTRNVSALKEEHVRRKRWESEQSHGKTDRTRVHHRVELSFLDRIANGLSPKKRKDFFKFVHSSDRWPNMRTGNEDVNMLGIKKDSAFKKIHREIHLIIANAGLDPDTVDFTGATMQQRMEFLDEVAPILDQIDEFIYNQIMAGKYPDSFQAFKI